MTRPRLPLWIAAMLAGAFLVTLAGALALWNYADASGCSPKTPAVFTHLYTIPSPSMAPTLTIGDWIWARRRYYCGRDPAHGDLALFVSPKARRTVFVRRIVGLPGDRVQLKAGQIFINGAPVEQVWMESAMHDDGTGTPRHISLFTESLGGKRYVVQVESTEGANENTPEFTVPNGEYFVLGDNRDVALDSRMPEMGLVPRDLIADRPARILWGATWDRVGKRIE